MNNMETDQQDTQEIQSLVLSDEDALVLNGDISILENMRELFWHPYMELDGMNRAQYYQSNREKDLSYIPPKRNRGEIRIVTGTTREKDTTLLSTLLNLNAEPDVTAFDEDDLVVAELGDNMSDLIKRSREIEEWQRKRPIVYREMIAQGDVFLEETYCEEYRDIPLENVEWDPLKDSASELKFNKRLQKTKSAPAVQMIKGNMVFLGDMTTEYIEDQNKAAICYILPRSVAEARYGRWDRWKYVPRQVTIDKNFESTAGAYSKVWSMFETKDDQVSVVKLWIESQNRYQMYLNGIPMMPRNFPLSQLWPSGKKPLIQGKLEPIPGFALSKSQPSKTKVDQQILDEMSRLMVEGMRQSRKPPMGYSGDKQFSPGIFLAGSMTQDVSKNTFHSLLPPEALGLKTAEFSFYNLIKESINEKTTNEVYSGEGQGDVDTLGQAEIMQQQQMLKLGAATDGVINLERSLAWQRIYTNLHLWMAPVDSKLEKTKEGVLKQVNKYRKLSVESSVENGQTGRKMFRFQEDEFPSEGEIYREEEELSKTQGVPVRIKYMNPEKLRKLKFTWFILVNPTPKSNDKLSQLLFVQNIRTAMELFGPESLNMEYIKQRFATLINEDYTKYFKQMNIMDMFDQGLSGTIGEAAGGPATPQRKTNTQQPKVAVAK
jgi:hypothetical protein